MQKNSYDHPNFSVNHKKTKVKSAKEKTIEVKVQRDVLGFLLAKSQELKSPIDIDEALKHPLSPVPLSIAHGMEVVKNGKLIKVLF